MKLLRVLYFAKITAPAELNFHVTVYANTVTNTCQEWLSESLKQLRDKTTMRNYSSYLWSKLLLIEEMPNFEGFLFTVKEFERNPTLAWLAFT